MEHSTRQQKRKEKKKERKKLPAVLSDCRMESDKTLLLSAASADNSNVSRVPFSWANLTEENGNRLQEGIGSRSLNKDTCRQDKGVSVFTVLITCWPEVAETASEILGKHRQKTPPKIPLDHCRNYCGSEQQHQEVHEKG